MLQHQNISTITIVKVSDLQKLVMMNKKHSM